MRVTLEPGGISGNICAIPSKSHVHRLLITAALAQGETLVKCPHTTGVDIAATIACLEALGAKITSVEEGYHIQPIDRGNLPETCVLPCEESGSTLRFLVPVVCALGVTGVFSMAGRLPQRPMEPLTEELGKKGIRFWWETPERLCCAGKLQAGEYTLPGNVSSQYITGLLLALPLLEKDSVLTIAGTVESQDYISLTTAVLQEFGYQPAFKENSYHITGGKCYHSPGHVQGEGDWSNAAFWLCAGAMPGGNITMTGLDPNSLQGDKEVLDILAQMGAKISWENGAVTVQEGARRGVEIDAMAVPDLIPVLSCVAAVSDGKTIVKNAARLRLKESDRIKATAETLNALGAKVTELPAGLEIIGVEHLAGGQADGWGDHRIAMMAGVASLAAKGPVVVTNAQVVNKSYPGFWNALVDLGKTLQLEQGGQDHV